MLLRTFSEVAASIVHRGIAKYYLRKPELKELLRIKFPTLGALPAALRNELAFLRRAPASYRLTSLNIEVTNFCNLACSFCPVNRGMQRSKRFLDPALFRKVIDATPTLQFVLPFQWGEPLLHPEIGGMVRYASERGIRTMLTTNGTLLDAARCHELCTSGLTRLTISIDGDALTHERVRGVALAPLRDQVLELRRIRDALRSPLKIDVSMVIDAATRDAYAAFVAQWRPLVDRVQAIPRMEQARSTPCRELWRGSLVVLADGRVTVCCVDVEAELALGDVHTQTPAAIFDGAAIRQLRAAHAAHAFPSVCALCAEHDAADLGIHARFS
ncbi:MAG: radical SAM protein [Planctomycetota bacterium]